MNRYGVIFYRLIYAILTFTFSGFAWYAIASNLPPALIILGIVGAIILISAFVLFELQREEVKEAKEEAKEAEEQVSTISQGYEKLSEYRLISYTLEHGMTDILRDILSDLEKANQILMSIESGSDEKNKEVYGKMAIFLEDCIEKKKLLIERVLRKICDGFEFDPTLETSTQGLHTYFKATIFEPAVETPGEGILKRAFFSYPRGMRPKTTKIEEKRPPGISGLPAAIVAWRSEEMVVLQNIQQEMEKKSQWLDLYPDQHSNYKSMICYPIIHGRPGDEASKVIAILTIDTDREEYFKNDNENKAFIAEVLHPYSILIGYVYEITIFEDKLRETFKNFEIA